MGTDLPNACPSGTYQDEEGQDYCKGCPAGMSYTVFSPYYGLIRVLTILG